MRIAVAQMGSRAGDFDATVPRMADYARRAADAGADLLVFPAMTLSGATPVPYQDREGFLLDLAGALLALSEDLPLTCLVPVLSDFDGTPVAEALLVCAEEVRPVRLSTYLEAAAAGVEDDRAPLPELELAGARLGIAFSYEDLDDYDDYDYDVDAVVFLSPYGFATDDASSALGMAVTQGRYLADAEATGAWVVGVGSLGCYDGQVFCGSSFVLAPWGELAAQAPSLEEALLVCDVDPSAEGPLAHPLTPEVFDAPLAAWGALTLGLQEMVAQAGAQDACLVVDDTLAAGLLATLATDALGPTHVRALVPRTGERAADELAEAAVRALRLPEANVSRLDVSGEKDPALARDLAEVRLAALARETGALALGAADKTGLALEDGPAVSAARLLPFADLYRSDVIALAHLRNTISPVVSASARVELDVPGTAELQGQMGSAELRLGFVDLVLSSYLEWERSVSDIACERGHAEAVEAVVRALRDHEARRQGVPAQIVLTSRTLTEASAPRGLAWRDRVRSEDERLGEATREAIARAQAEMVAGAGGAGAGGAGTGDAASAGEDDAASAGADAPGEALRERDVRDLLGYLRDFSLGGGFSPSGAGASGGRHGSAGGPGTGSAAGGLWDGPFSEN